MRTFVLLVTRMTTQLTTCIYIPRIYTHLASQQVPNIYHRSFVIASAATDRAVLIDVSQQAVAHGIVRGMSVAEARLRCNDLLVVPVIDLDTNPFEHAIEKVMLRHSDVCERQSIDIWMAELTALGRNYASAMDHLRQFQHDLIQYLHMPCVLGAGSNRLVATIAAQRAGERPNIVLPGRETKFLAPLPIRLLPGVGSQTNALLSRLGITTIGDLARISEADAARILGSSGPALRLSAEGLETSIPNNSKTTIAERWTCQTEPCRDHHVLRAQVHLLTERIGRAIRSDGVGVGALTIRITWLDRTHTQRTSHFVPRRNLDYELTSESRRLLEHLLAARRMAIIAVDVSVSDLGGMQQDLFAPDNTKRQRYQRAVDVVKTRHGTGAIVAAWMLRHIRRAA
jgi:DNA polymerase IV